MFTGAAQCLINILFLALGGVTLLVVVPIWISISGYSSAEDPIDFYLKIAVYVFVAIAVILVVFSISGCFSRKSKALFTIVFILWLCVMIVQGTTAFWLYKNQPDVEKYLIIAGTKTLQSSYGASQIVSYSTDFVQRSYKCCGVFSKWDYLDSAFNNNTKNKMLPKSCCNIDNHGDKCKANVEYNSAFVFNQGCALAIEEFLKINKTTLSYTGYGIVGVEIFTLSVLLLLCVCTKKKPRYNKVHTEPRH